MAAATIAVTDALSRQGLIADLLTLALAGLVIVFGIWWLYFKHDATEVLAGMAGRRERIPISLLWGYGHYGIFASIAAVGAGLELSISNSEGAVRSETVTAAFALAVPVALYLVLRGALHSQLPEDNPYLPLGYTYLAAVLCIAAAGLAAVASLPFAVCAIAFVVAAFLAGNLLWAGRARQSIGPAAGA